MARPNTPALQLDNDAIDRLLSAMHAVAPSTDDAESAVHVRLRYLQKLGFPSGANAGRGRRVTHGIEAVVQIAVAFELLTVGLSPKRAAATVSSGWDRVLEALRAGWRAWGMTRTGAALTEVERVRIALTRMVIRVSQPSFDDASDAMSVFASPFLEGEEAGEGRALVRVGDPFTPVNTEIEIDAFGLLSQLRNVMTDALRLRDEDVEAALDGLLGSNIPNRK